MKLLFLFLALLPTLFAEAQPTQYAGRTSVTPLQLQQRGDSLYIHIRYDIQGAASVGSRNSVSLIPQLVSSTQQKSLLEVCIKGRNSYRKYLRDQVLMTKKEQARYLAHAPYAVVPGYNDKVPASIEFRQVLPFEPWMAEAQLDIQEKTSHCGGTRPRLTSVSQLVNRVQLEELVVPYQINPSLAYLRPEVEAVKHRELKSEAFLDFVVAKTDIHPDYMNNPHELKKITDMIAETTADAAVTVRSISVVGYASPEGIWAFNRTLSENRASALVSYLRSIFAYPANIYKVSFGGENWAGLRQVLAETQIPDKESILSILADASQDAVATVSQRRKQQLKRLNNGEQYRYMLREFYPGLRKAVCQIDYLVKGFDLEQARELITRRPQNLSLEEMFRVANSYENGSQPFVDVFETAVRMFPQDPLANLNAAAAALSRRDTTSAARYLSRVTTPSPERDNAEGVLAMFNGDYDRAEKLLDAARKAGLTEAQSNLEELARKRENEHKLLKQK